MRFFLNEKNNRYIDADIARIEEINRGMYKLPKSFCAFARSSFIFSSPILYPHAWPGHVKYLSTSVVIDCSLYAV